ncbi:pentapeptide repeat-containing protein [Paenibacillus glycanilyticus]|uniref:pentapeptide repeat-containing protein n=1 Tax=Paenibacillus glycanilyticus TaxID=126569 RepID=UPI00203B9E1E|nr:pentapeptide repeat-containing protein [Paenibacillus glycanilyticus]MCM3628288.1 pentapeptide repeat-containing protein [Paenibacillus glycanilyticus]
MNPITKWTFNTDTLGYVGCYYHELGYAGGLAIVGIGGGSSHEFNIYNLGGSLIALQDPETNWYWNSHYNDAMMLWNNIDHNFTSDHIGDEQKFRLINRGHGQVSFQCAAGPFAGKYIQSVQGGWYPVNWGYGNGTLEMKEESLFKVGGNLLPILIITNSARDLDLSGADLSGLNLDNADLTNAIFRGATFTKVQSFHNAQFVNADLQQANFDGLSLNGANFAYADFSGTDLTKILPSPSQLSHAKLIKANLRGVDLSKSNLTNANLSGAILDGANLSGADLSGADFTGASLVNTKLDGAIMHNTRFDHCNLTQVSFQYPPDFTRAEKDRTSFIQAVVPFKLLGSDWSYLDLSEAAITDIPEAFAALNANYALLPDGLDLSKKDLRGASFIGSRMYEIQLQEANLEKAKLAHARLKGAKLTGANLSMANLDSAYLISENAPSPSDPVKHEAAVVDDAFLFNTNLTGSFCDGVDFSGSLFMTYAGLDPDGIASAKGATMNLAKFNKAILIQADFDDAQLAGSDFSDAVLVGASFKQAQLTPATQPPNPDASFYEADLRGADCTGANMDGLDMRSAQVSTEQGEFTQIYKDYYGNQIPVMLSYPATALGNTTAGTTCPDGSKGPCHLKLLTASWSGDEN